MQQIFYVMPNASKTEILGEVEIPEDNALYKVSTKALKLKLAAPATEGKANAELISFLSKHYKVPKSSITIESGEKSRFKLVSFRDFALQNI